MVAAWSSERVSEFLLWYPVDCVKAVDRSWDWRMVGIRGVCLVEGWSWGSWGGWYDDGWNHGPWSWALRRKDERSIEVWEIVREVWSHFKSFAFIVVKQNKLFLTARVVRFSNMGPMSSTLTSEVCFEWWEMFKAKGITRLYSMGGNVGDLGLNYFSLRKLVTSSKFSCSLAFWVSSETER